ncbi:hypothetical protein Acid345_1112 [Candidatus Koribacter versatilis Ellin345]|uniref:Uncharacterized protein n=1 Tax=Koribacter versatilis (strain Ellin345) TaxID=204669 RepID=Q1ISN5_KORVE|nr:hypothetical protein [Candidatus Koribacter versatilis]ABF40115.1 hypothetical protein Acid345_1112 [Candidatus Koribacter versatilis Ellin345]
MRLKLAALCSLLVLSLPAFAQQPAADPAALASTVPNVIRYSGTLPHSAGKTVGITFTLHKNQTDQASLWMETQNVIVDATGKYSVLLGATKSTGMPANLFATGEARWLAVHVDGESDARVLLVSVPYAMKAAEAETLGGHALSEFITADKLSAAVREELKLSPSQGSFNVKNGSGAKTNVVTNTATNFADNNANQVVLVTQSGTGSGLVANAASGSGLIGTSGGAAGFGVSGSNTAVTGVPVGVRGTTVADSGISIYGTASGTGGSATGVKGITAAPAGYGVFGQNTATTGPAVGFRGTTASTAGIGIYGTATSATGTTTGIRANVASPNGVAAVFQNSGSGQLLSGQSGASNTEVFSVSGGGDVAANSLNLPATSATTGFLAIGGLKVMLAPGISGTNNFFAGQGAGNPTVSGSYNAGFGALSASNLSSGIFNTAIGYGALYNITTGTDNTAVGVEAGYPGEVTGSGNTYVGAVAGPSVDGLFRSTALGIFAKVGKSHAIVLGDSTDAALTLGIGTPTPSSTLSFNGDRITSIAPERSSGSNPGQQLGLSGGSAAVGSTDIAGGDLVLAAGYGTGLGSGGNLREQTGSSAALSGTADGLLVDRRIVVAHGKQLTLSSPGFTSLMSIHLVGTNTAGGRIYYTIRATDGGSQIATEEGVIQYLATANSITCTVQTTDKLHLGTVNSGCTPGFFNPGSQPGVSIFDNVSFSSPAPIVVHEIYFTIDNESGSSIRLEP